MYTSMARLGMSCMSTASCTLIRSCAKHSSLATGTISSLDMHHTGHTRLLHISSGCSASESPVAAVCWACLPFKAAAFLGLPRALAGDLGWGADDAGGCEPFFLGFACAACLVAGSAERCPLARVPAPWYSLGSCILNSLCTAAKLFFTWTVWTELWVLASIMNMHQLHCLMTLQQYTTAAATKHTGSSMLR